MKKKGFKNFYLIKSDIFKTLNRFLNEKKNLKISLLHLDLDVYDVTLYSLKKLYEKVVYSGIILLDDYDIEADATKVVDIFFKNREVAIHKVSLS